MKDGISVCFVIKNGITQGYPFWESLKSCLSFADEIVISEGYSDDGTDDVIRRFIDMYSDQVKFRLYRDDWDACHSPYGEVIATISLKNLRRCEYKWVYYLQADEVLHESNANFVKDINAYHSHEFNSVSFRFYHFINSWKPLESGRAYDEAIRMVKNSPDITFLGDAWNFQGGINPTCPAGLSPKPIYHLGWVFPKNCDIKSVEHGKIYAKHQSYQDSAAKAKQRMSDGNYQGGYEKPADFDDYPEGVARLFGLVEYQLPPEAYK